MYHVTHSTMKICSSYTRVLANLIAIQTVYCMLVFPDSWDFFSPKDVSCLQNSSEGALCCRFADFLFSPVLKHDAALSSAQKSVSLSKVIHLPGVMFAVSNHGVCLSFYVKRQNHQMYIKGSLTKKQREGDSICCYFLCLRSRRIFKWKNFMWNINLGLKLV